jgi:transposase
VAQAGALTKSHGAWRSYCFRLPATGYRLPAARAYSACGDPTVHNHDEQQIRPWATGRKNWLFAGTLAAGQRAAVITSLIQSAKLNGHDPYVYLKDVLERLPTQRASEIGQLLPHRWAPGA